MKLLKLSEIFEIRYGHQLNANSLDEDDEGVNFVTRSSKRLGISGKVARLNAVEPHPAGAITVTLGGTYLLSAFVQPEEFYTAQNIKILRPKIDMNFQTKVFYSLVISSNRFRYSSHGREANRSLNSLLVPSLEEVPEWVDGADAHMPHFTADDFVLGGEPAKSTHGLVPLSTLFRLVNGVNPSASIRHEDRINPFYLPLVRPSKTQDSCYVEYVDRTKVDPNKIFPKNTLYISTNGQGSHSYSYVAPFEFIPNSDVSVALPKRPMTLAEKLFYAGAISSNRHLFSYGRKPKGNRLAQLLVPSTPPKFIYGADGVGAILGEITAIGCG